MQELQRQAGNITAEESLLMVEGVSLSLDQLKKVIPVAKQHQGITIETPLKWLVVIIGN